ncbi:PD-(D/E)XK nuclease family protein [Emticicia sp.]|uniref:PD-(D/E)XK nuclease family protein n=1 Tax=Emticicia sp. TaxID=1930953 RepID=UPI003751D07E
MIDTYHHQLQTALNDLMLKFNDLPPIIEQNPTFLEITEYPHYENVCSNILRFYFDTSQPHGLKNLLLKSLLQAIDKDDLAEQIIKTERDNVNREVRTDDAKRIDLLIQTDEHIIAIENKIYHHLTNQLSYYQNHVEVKYSKLKPLYVLLAPEKIIAQNLPQTLKSDKECLNEDAEKGFKSITFNELFNKVKTNLGEYIQNADTKYLAYFIDFMTSIENLDKSMTLSPELVKFVTENEENIQKVNKAYDEVWYEVYEKIKKIKEQIFNSNEKNLWIYDKSVLVREFYLKRGNDTINVALNCSFTLHHVNIEIFVRGNKVDNKYSFLESIDYFSQSKDNFEKSKRGFIVYKNHHSPFEIDNLEIITKLNEIIPQIKISE